MTDGPALDPATMFEDVFKQMPPHLVRQREELLALKALKDPQLEARNLEPQTRSVAKEG